jgi:hypothetical protein
LLVSFRVSKSIQPLRFGTPVLNPTRETVKKYDLQFRVLMSTPINFFGLRHGFSFCYLFPHRKLAERH